MSIEIPKKYRDRLSVFSDRLGRTVEELSNMLIELYNYFDMLDPKKPSTKKWDIAYSRLYGNLRREDKSIFSPAPMWSGLIWGDTGAIDYIELAKKKAISWYNNPEKRAQAIAEGLVDAHGVPLDTREKINYNREDNPNYGRPYKNGETSYYRAIYGVCSKGNTLTNDLSFFRLNINGDHAKDVTIPPQGLVVHFRANVRKKQSYGFLDLNAISDTEVVFTEAEDQTVPDIDEALSLSAWKPISIAELDTAYEKYSSVDRSIPILLRANVAIIGTEINDKTRNRTLWVDDEELAFQRSGVSVFIDGDIPITFGLDSKVIFVGRIDKITGDEPRLLFSAYGYYAIPDYLTYLTPID